MKLSIVLISGIALLSLASCDKGTDVSCKVTNNTSKTLTVTAYYKYLTTGQNAATIRVGETKEVFIANRPKGRFDDEIKVEQVLDSITTRTDDRKTFKKYFNKTEDWTKEVDNKKNRVTFTTVIKDSDIK